MKYSMTILRFALSQAIGQGGKITPKETYDALIRAGVDVSEYKVRQMFKEFADDGMMALVDNRHYELNKEYMQRLCEYAGVLS